jgi:hypothetical protein
MDKNLELIASFKRYCISHPEERFWQALRNWSSYNFIWVSGDLERTDLKDTFYFEGKDK